MMLLLACATEEAPQVYVDEAMLATDAGAYPALDDAAPELRPGVQGLVKLLAEHTLSGTHDGDAVSGSYVTKGTSTLVVDGSDWFVVTALHVVVPNPAVDSLTLPRADGEFDEVFFDEVSSLATRISIGPLAVRPSSVLLSTGSDLAVLRIAEADRGAVLEGLEAFEHAPLPLAPATPKAGAEAQAWGFPSRTHPQVERLAVSSVREGFFVLNRALEPGTSGGPVLVDEGRRVAGVVTRSDADANQTTALAWPSLPLEGVSVDAHATAEFGGRPLQLL